MPTTTGAKTAPKTAAPNGSAGSGSAEPKNARKPRKAAVKVDDVSILSEVGAVSVSDVPREARTRGTRNNPFDEHLRISYEANDEGQDVYRQVKVKSDQVDAVKALIRGAANFHDIGSKILKEDDHGDGTATVWFRAQERRVKGPRKPKTDTGA